MALERGQTKKVAFMAGKTLNQMFPLSFEGRSWFIGRTDKTSLFFMVKDIDKPWQTYRCLE
jgi:hypothetical protein